MCDFITCIVQPIILRSILVPAQATEHHFTDLFLLDLLVWGGFRFSKPHLLTDQLKWADSPWLLLCFAWIIGVQKEVLLLVPAPWRLLHPQLLQGWEELQGNQRLHIPGLLHRRRSGTLGGGAPGVKWTPSVCADSELSLLGINSHPRESQCVSRPRNAPGAFSCFNWRELLHSIDIGQRSPIGADYEELLLLAHGTGWYLTHFYADCWGCQGAFRLMNMLRKMNGQS